MGEPEPLLDAESNARYPEAIVEELATRIGAKDHATVEACNVPDEPAEPCHLIIAVTDEEFNPRVPPAVVRLLEKYPTEVDPSSIEADDAGVLRLRVNVHQGFTPVERTNFGKWGNSVAVSIPRTALELSRLEEGDDLVMKARESSILLSKPPR
jgi:hypothetical protein